MIRKRLVVPSLVAICIMSIVLIAACSQKEVQKNNVNVQEKVQSSDESIEDQKIDEQIDENMDDGNTQSDIQADDQDSSKSDDEYDPSFDLPPDKNSAGWKQTSGPLGGTVIRMIPHAGTIWASLYSGGIYELQSDNSWRQIAVGHGIPEVRAFDIVPDPITENMAYVPEMIACGAKTVNNGATWQGLCSKMLKDIEADNFNSHTLVLDPEDSRTIYMPGHIHDQTSMLVVSKDGGDNWEKRFIFDKHYDFNHILFFKSKMYLATSNDGVLVSSDKGKTWIKLNNGLEDMKTARFVNFKGNLYLLGAQIQFNTRMGGNLYMLASDGLSWEKIKELEQVTGLGTDGDTLFVGTWSPDPKLWISIDGISFQEKDSKGLPPDWVGEIVNLDSKIYVGAGGNGIYVSSDDGDNFVELNKDLVSIATREVHVNPDDETEIYAGTWDRLGFYWSKNEGKSYRHLARDYFALTLEPDPEDFTRVYLGGDKFVVGHISKDKSEFTEKNKPGSSSSFIKSLAIDPKNKEHIIVGIGSEVAETPPGEGIWESKDGGESWTRSQGISDFAVYSIIFNPNDPRIVYASALGEGVFKSIDGGSHFNFIRNDKLKYTYRLVMSPTDSDMIIASSNLFFGQLSDQDQYSGKYGGIFQSNDAGKNWKEITAGIRNYEGGDREEDFLPWLYNFGHMPNYENILIDPKNPEHLIVGHHGENVVETIDGGKNWKKSGLNDMVPGGVHNYAYCLGSSSNFDKFYACTCGRGLFQGNMNDKGYISFSSTGNAVYKIKNDADLSHPRNAQEAKEFLLSGEYNHQH